MRYRIDHVAGVYRLNGTVPQQYNFKKGRWEFTIDAGNEFIEGLSSYEATEQEALSYINKVEQLRNTRK